jgi:hypothetical protein
MPIATLDVTLGTVRISFLQGSADTECIEVRYLERMNVTCGFSHHLGWHGIEGIAGLQGLQGAGHYLSVQTAAGCTVGS